MVQDAMLTIGVILGSTRPGRGERAAAVVLCPQTRGHQVLRRLVRHWSHDSHPSIGWTTRCQTWISVRRRVGSDRPG